MPARGSGIREKLKSASQPDSNAPAGAVLKRLYKKGKLSAPDIVEASQVLPRSSGTATQDGPSKWATAGHGRRKHMSRDIMRSMTASSTKPEIYSTHMTFWDPDLNEQVEDEVYCLIPYETVDKLADRDGDLSQYTSLPEGSPFLRRKAEWMERVGAQGDGHDIVCCGLWGDGAAYHTRDSLNLLLFNMVSGIIRTRFWIATWSKRLSCNCGCSGRCTLASFWRGCSPRGRRAYTRWSAMMTSCSKTQTDLETNRGLNGGVRNDQCGHGVRCSKSVPIGRGINAFWGCAGGLAKELCSDAASNVWQTRPRCPSPTLR